MDGWRESDEVEKTRRLRARSATPSPFLSRSYRMMLKPGVTPPGPTATAAAAAASRPATDASTRPSSRRSTDRDSARPAMKAFISGRSARQASRRAVSA